MVAVGGVMSLVIVICELELQPLEPVTVTVYVPGCAMVTLALLPKPLLHEYEPPPVAVKLIEVLTQFNSVLPVRLVMDAVGILELAVTIICAVEVHPFVPVTVK